MIYQAKGDRDHDDADEFVSDMKKASSAFGIKVDDPFFVTVNSYKP